MANILLLLFLLFLPHALSRRVIPQSISEYEEANNTISSAQSLPFIPEEKYAERRLGSDDRRVKSLPGLDDKSYTHLHFSGYIEVDKKHGGHLSV